MAPAHRVTAGDAAGMSESTAPKRRGKVEIMVPG
jgi:hypothetical protein